jgi:hypothetical protein
MKFGNAHIAECKPFDAVLPYDAPRVWWILQGHDSLQGILREINIDMFPETNP